MKRILLLSLLSLVFLISGCNKTPHGGHGFDQSYAKVSVSLEEVMYNGFTVRVDMINAVDGYCAYFENGVQIPSTGEEILALAKKYDSDCHLCPPSTRWTEDGLRPGTTYQLVAFAIGRGGDCAISEVIKFVTLK